MMSANSNVPKTLFKDIRMGDCLDAHAWVEYENGKRVDPHFASYEKICEVRGLDINQPEYQEFDPIVQQLCWSFAMKHKIGPIQESMLEYCQEQEAKAAAAGKKVDHIELSWPPQAGHCFMNAYMEWLRSDQKGVLKCGSMGWKEKSGDSVHWEFG
jgi:hypothetical protein